ncbi:MAG: S41 family peptidase [Cyclobacteriaceae bacterium]
MIATVSCSQPQSIGQESKKQNDIIENIVTQFNNNYVFPEVAEEMGAHLYNQLEKEAYAGLDSKEFAAQLTEDMRSITNDKHVRINHVERDANDKPTNSLLDMHKRFKNYGFEESKILEGNIGYIDLRLFFPINTDTKAKIIVQEIMSEMATTDALIFDLRKCVGGSPEMISLLVSYLYPEDTIIHLNNFFYRPTNSTFKSYTLKEIDGNRFPDMPVYILTGAKTFSAAEEFCYDLKNLKRATLVGVNTGGGAHTVEPRKINNDFEMSLPTGRAINPISNTNWEGVGVTPHWEVSEEQALTKAHLLAVESLAKSNVNAEQIAIYQALIQKFRIETN